MEVFQNPTEPEVKFCELCQESIPEKEISSGKVISIEGKLICPRCKKKIIAPYRSFSIISFFFSFIGILLLCGLVVVGYLGKQTFSIEFSQIKSSFNNLKGNIEELRNSQTSLEERLKKTQEESNKSLIQRFESEILKLKKEQTISKKDFSERIETLKNLLFEQREEVDKKLLLLAERLSALEAAEKKRKQEIDQLGLGLEAVSKNTEKLISLVEELYRANSPETPLPTTEEEKQKYLTQLEKLLNEGNVEQRYDAVGKLEKIGGPKACKLVSSRLKDPDMWVRRFAAVVLGRMGGVIAIEELIKALDDKEQVVREAAFESLKKLTGKTHGYSPGLSQKERKRAIERWKAWWAIEKARLKSKKS